MYAAAQCRVRTRRGGAAEARKFSHVASKGLQTRIERGLPVAPKGLALSLEGLASSGLPKSPEGA